MEVNVLAGLAAYANGLSNLYLPALVFETGAAERKLFLKTSQAMSLRMFNRLYNSHVLAGLAVNCERTFKFISASFYFFKREHRNEFFFENFPGESLRAFTHLSNTHILAGLAAYENGLSNLYLPALIFVWEVWHEKYVEL